MKFRINTLTGLLSVLLVACMGLFISSCGDDDEPETEQVYSWGFDQIHSSNLNFLTDMSKIENAFKSAMGVNETDAYLVKKGKADKCDREVREVCDKAYDSLEGSVWQGDYTFIVTNVTTGKQVVKYTFDADN